MSDRIVVMNAGRVEQDGTPEDLYFHPASRFVAEFIGETNLLTGQVRGIENREVLVDWQGHALRGRAPVHKPQSGETVTLSVRLERVGFHSQHPHTANALQGRVVGRTFLGSRMAVDVLIEDAQGAILKAYVDTSMTKNLGTGTVWIGWDADSMAVLHADRVPRA